MKGTPPNMIDGLIAAGESSVLEFKSTFDRQAIETLAAFANSKGGTVVVGVNDHGKIAGISFGLETAQQWVNQVKSSTAPTIIPDIESLVIDGKTVAMITIAEYPIKPVSCKGKYFKRFHNSNKRIIDEFSAYGLTIPRFEDFQHGFRVTVFGATPQATPQVTPQVQRLLKICIDASSREDLQQNLGIKDKKYFREAFLVPAINAGLIEPTIPDAPQSPHQKYKLTALGLRVVEGKN